MKSQVSETVLQDSAPLAREVRLIAMSANVINTPPCKLPELFMCFCSTSNAKRRVSPSAGKRQTGPANKLNPPREIFSASGGNALGLFVIAAVDKGFLVALQYRLGTHWKLPGATLKLQT
jgi:hypothetical protein